MRVKVQFKERLKNFPAALFLAGCVVSNAVAEDYFVDSTAGNDGNSGTSQNSPWQTLSKVNANTFSAGDRIFFSKGESWIGTLNPKGSGASGNPIIISSYGSNTNRPVINGNGNADAVVLTNQQYWEINDLEVVNPAAADAERRGIHLCAADFGLVNHLYVSNCYVHNVHGRVDTSNGDLSAKRSGGIIVEVTSDATVPTRFNDVIIQNCTISSVTNQGIVACVNRSGGGDYPGTSAWNARFCSGVIIRSNIIHDVCKNAMSIRYGDQSCRVERNIVYDTALTTSGNQIAAYGCRGTVFQFNEGYRNRGGDADRDGSLYDSDLRCVQTVWQYSYSHDNYWGLYTHYAAAGTGHDTNQIVRYNISVNDHGDIFALTGDGGAISSEFIYNNTIYISSNFSPVLIDDRTGGHTTYFNNNIVYNLSQTTGWHFTSANTNHIDCNVFFGQHPSTEPNDAHKIAADPKFIEPGTSSNGLASLSGYKLQFGSPCTDSGLSITANYIGNPNLGGTDFYGNVVPFNGSTDRGANEWSGAPPVVATLPAANVTASGAELNALINPGGIQTRYYFQYGLTTNYGNVSSIISLPAGTHDVSSSSPISGLFPNALYHYRVAATNVAGINFGADADFTTARIEPIQLGSAAFSNDGTFNFSSTNAPGIKFHVYAANNLEDPASNWESIGFMTESSAGQYQFLDLLATNLRRFYQVRWP